MTRLAGRSPLVAMTLAVVVLAAVTVASDAPGYAGELLLSPGVPATSTAPPHGARLIFSDDFHGSTLDSRWITCYPWAKPGGCTNPATGELEWYDPGGVSVSDGALHLTARRRVVTEDGHRYAFTSGMVATAGTFHFTYGYVQFRAHVPSGTGLWPALWLLPSSESWPPEIDVLEVQGADPSVAALTYHPIHRRQEQRQVHTTNLSEGWHVFAIDWTPDSIVWYVDGRAAFEVTGDVPSQPMYLVMDLAVSGLQPPNASTTFPASLDVNDVRVWQPG